MFRLIDYIAKQRNVVLGIKKIRFVTVKNWYIYLNATLLMVVFIGVFFLVGYLFNIIDNWPYMIYSFALSILSSFVLLHLSIEKRFKKLYDVEYHSFYTFLDEFIYLAGVLFGLISVIFILLIPEVSTVMDIILCLLIFFVSLLYIFLCESRISNFSLHFLIILYDVFISSILLISCFVVIDIQNPWIWFLIFTAGIGILYIFAIDLWKTRDFHKNKNFKSVTSYSWVLALICFLILSSTSFFVKGAEESHNYTGTKPKMEDIYTLSNATDILDMYIESDEVTVISRNSNTYKLLFYDKNFSLVSSKSFDHFIQFQIIKDQLYLYENYYDHREFFKVVDNELQFLSIIEDSRSKNFPIFYNNQYYLVFPYFYNSTRIDKIVSIEDQNTEIDLTSKSFGESYQDSNLYLYFDDEQNEYQFTSEYEFTSDWTPRILYNNGYLGIDDYSIITVENIDSNDELQNQIVELPSRQGSSKLYVYEDLFVTYVDAFGVNEGKISVYNQSGALLSELANTNMVRFYEDKAYILESNTVHILSLKNLSSPVFLTACPYPFVNEYTTYVDGVITTISPCRGEDNFAFTTYGLSSDYKWAYLNVPLALIVIYFRKQFKYLDIFNS